MQTTSPSPKDFWCVQHYNLTSPQKKSPRQAAHRTKPICQQPLVLTIGNFDGVHLGHKALLQCVLQQAKQHQAAPALLTFSPHPASVLGTKVPQVLTTRQHMLQCLHEARIEHAFFLRFNRCFAQVSAQHFMQHGLLRELVLKALVVGEGFRFGNGRRGNVALLKDLCQAYGIQVSALAAVRVEGCIVSSSRIRQSLVQTHFGQAAMLLGRPYGLLSQVITGKKQGRALGFATLNMVFQRTLPLPYGVYAVRVKVDKAWYNGVSNYGLRPTLTGDEQPVLETHVFAFTQNVYGAWVEVRPLHMLRHEQRFVSLDALKAQIGQDCEQAKVWLSCRPDWSKTKENNHPFQPFT